MCSGCINENLRHRKELQIENKILNSNATNETLAPIIHHTTTPTELKRVRKLLSHLPSFNNIKRDDHIYGVTRYIANSLGIIIKDSSASELIDAPLTSTEKKQAWRVAEENSCPKKFNSRTFCKTCSCLIFNDDISHVTLCPKCKINESWEIIGLPCLACQCVTIVYRDPFCNRFPLQLEQWLSCEVTDVSSDATVIPARLHTPQTVQTDADMLRQRNNTFEKTFQTMKNRASTEQTQFIFENLSILQRSIQINCSTLKRDSASQDDSTATPALEEENISPKKV